MDVTLDHSATVPGPSVCNSNLQLETHQSGSKIFGLHVFSAINNNRLKTNEAKFKAGSTKILTRDRFCETIFTIVTSVN